MSEQSAETPGGVSAQIKRRSWLQMACRDLERALANLGRIKAQRAPDVKSERWHVRAFRLHRNMMNALLRDPDYQAPEE